MHEQSNLKKVKGQFLRAGVGGGSCLRGAVFQFCKLKGILSFQEARKGQLDEDSPHLSHLWEGPGSPPPRPCQGTGGDTEVNGHLPDTHVGRGRLTTAVFPDGTSPYSGRPSSARIYNIFLPSCY